MNDSDNEISTIDNLIMQRARIKGALTRFDTYLKKISLLAMTDEIRTEINTRLEKVNSLYSDFNTVQTCIEQSGPQEFERNEQERDDFESKYFSIVATAKTKVNKSAALGQNTHLNVSYTDTNSAQGNPMANIKLPEISLPHFNGSYDLFIPFQQAFESLINQNPLITSVQKFFYLQGALKGEAAQVISSLSATEENYKIAWDLLNERYQNKKTIIHSHMKAIFELPSINKESHTRLRKILDDFQKHFRALRNLGENVDEWNTILIFLLNSKIDTSTRKDWEIFTKSITSPKIDDYVKFLSQRCHLFESLDLKGNIVGQHAQTKLNTDNRSYSHVTTYPLCPVCSQSHFVYTCKSFFDIPVNKRLTEIKRWNLCSNCLRPGHTNSECRSTHKCHTCQGRHHTLLHVTTNQSPTNKRQNANWSRNTSTNAEHIAQITSNAVTKGDDNTNNSHACPIQTNEPENVCAYSSSYLNTNPSVLLSTAIIKVYTNDGKTILCRALLDSGSQSNFILKEAFDKLNIKSTHIKMPISGISQSITNISERAIIKAQSNFNNYSFELPFLIINTITGIMPSQRINLEDIKVPDNIQLADQNFNTPANIDMLLGAGIFYELLSIGQIKLGRNLPILHKTKLGWIVSGPFPGSESATQNSCFLNISEQIHTQMQNFWHIEETNQTAPILTKVEKECENHFATTFSRDNSGRFTVSLPLKEHYHKLGNSEENSINRFHTLEKKLNKNPELKEQYSNFMNEYQILGHMSKIDPKQPTAFPIYYLPHHAVFKSDSITTKLRVVFDGSAKTSSGLSLNDMLKVGPTVQRDLFSILIRFRQHNVVLTADIAMMYRQINITPNERSIQRIVWRSNPSDRISHFELNTVTYGTASASFLATRALKQVALESAENYPTESNIILNDFYVDDLITGASKPNDLIMILRNLVTILSSYGFNLRKFSSNEASVLDGIISDSGSHIKHLINDAPDSKTLGICYEPKNDAFVYNSQQLLTVPKSVTKRSILAAIAQIFDPLGLLGPIIIQAKIIIQKLWLANLNWDDPVPIEIYKSWIHFANLIATANILKIPRQAILKEPIDIELHGFCDASINAYGACIYLRSQNAKGDVQITLLCAKSRVAPIKALSLPRLELSGALLLAQLTQRIMAALSLNIRSKYYWTDSTIVLSWLSAEPRTWKTFVCNRVSEIQQISETSNWYHVASANNPADIISRGINPNDLQNASLWWQGPSFLLQPKSNWPSDCNISNFSKGFPETPETNPKFTLLCTSDTNIIFTKFSCLIKLIHVVSYCLRLAKGRILKEKLSINSLHIEAQEWQNTEIVLIKLAQSECFSDDFRTLRLVKSVKSNSKLRSLNPFVDENGILRVGGRLEHAFLPFNTKHPILLAKGHPFTTLLIRHVHKTNFHAGCQATLSFIRQRFWPVDGRNAVRKIIRACTICFKADPPVMFNQMGNLPAVRVTPARIFSNCGLDYAGPFLLKDGKYRNRKILKCYICIFICLATKAVHVELVSELTSECFIAAFRRFVARRGMCNNMYSDNGSNFVSASNTFKEIYRVLNSQSVLNYFCSNQMQWHFIPPRSPHFGGLWEASVKSLKYHLKRGLANISYTYEEFLTILTQIEAIMNSRPLCPLSSDPNDLEALTPGHFIIGQALNSAPQTDATDIPINKLSRFQQLQKLTQNIWTRWKSDYLHNLHQRTKWQFKTISTLKGKLVLLHDDNTSPQRWSLGRITAVHPGADSVVRVVSVYVRGKTLKRAITKLSLLPID